jgi:hypothetical protein
MLFTEISDQLYRKGSELTHRILLDLLGFPSLRLDCPTHDFPSLGPLEPKVLALISIQSALDVLARPIRKSVYRGRVRVRFPILGLWESEDEAVCRGDERVGGDEKRGGRQRGQGRGRTVIV